MTGGRRIAPRVSGGWSGGGRATSQSPCKASCCKTPYGHSAAATNCKCHESPPVDEWDRLSAEFEKLLSEETNDE